MCGLLAYLSTDADRVDDADGRPRAARPALPAPPRSRRHGGVVTTAARCSGSTGCRSSTSTAAPSPSPTPRAATGSCSTARSTTTSSCARSSPPPARRSRTHGDTETIVAGYHLWGEDVVTRLRGMFAFVIWDTADRDGVRRPRPLRHQAAVHRAAGRRRPGLQLREEGAAGAAGRQQGAPAAWTPRRCSTT